MLETVKKYVNRKPKTFEEVFVDYVLKIQNANIIQEFKYIMKHNKLDIFRLDKLIEQELKQAKNDDIC